MNINLIGIFLLILSFAGFSQSDLSKEIERIKIEIIEYEAKIKDAKTRKETLKERMDYEESEFVNYKKRMDSLLVIDKKTEDSLKAVLYQSNSKIDSLELKIFNLDKVKKLEESELISFKKVFKEECNNLIEELNKLPLVMVNDELSSLRYLLSSLNSGSSSISEGVSRYIDIIRLIESSSQTIEIINSETPEGFALEKATYIRIGYSYAAFITESKEIAALWGCHKGSTSRKWIEIKNIDEKKAIQKAIALRKRKEAPALGYLPFYDNVINRNEEEL